MHINGHKAHVLLDGGSTIDMISANFVSIYKLDLFQLKKPVKLQMATLGSCSVINFRVKAEIECGDYSQTCYFGIDIPDVALVIDTRKQTQGARKPKPKPISLSSSD